MSVAKGGTREKPPKNGKQMENRRFDFPIFTRKPETIYLDSAATSQKPFAVVDAEANFYKSCNANTHRAGYALARMATERFEAARTTVAEFINAPSADCVVFTSGTTNGTNLVAHSWAEPNLADQGGLILATHMEHHSNIVPWQLLRDRHQNIVFGAVEITDDGLLDLDDLERKRDIAEFLHLTEAGEGVRIFIGSENKLFSLSGSSLVVSPYMNADRKIIGAVGVIGPTRLNYGRIVPIVDYTAQLVGRLVSDRGKA